jgi:hypothetical protein
MPGLPAPPLLPFAFCTLPFAFGCCVFFRELWFAAGKTFGFALRFFLCTSPLRGEQTDRIACATYAGGST